MVFITIISLLSGIFMGNQVLDEDIVSFLNNNSDYVMCLFMLLIGISIGSNKNVFKNLRKNCLIMFLIPVGIVSGSMLGGFICSLFIDIPLNKCMAVVSGLGWYTLSCTAVSDLAGVELGTVALISNLLRELISFITIPVLSKYVNPYTAIAPAAATSEDTSLPMLIKYTSEDIVLMAVFNGVVCSLLVPVLTQIFL